MRLAVEKTLVTITSDSTTGFKHLRTTERAFKGLVAYGRHRISALDTARSERWTRRTAGPVEQPPPVRAGEHHFGSLDKTTVRQTCDLLRSRLASGDGQPAVTLTLHLEAKTVRAEGVAARQTAVFFTLEARPHGTEVHGDAALSLFTGGPFHLEGVRQTLIYLEARLALPLERPGPALRRLLRRASLVLGPQALGTVWHEVVHQLEWDRCHRHGALGQEICRFDGLSVVESPGQPTFGWNAVTDEGLPALEKVLVDGGSVTGVLDSWGFRQNGGAAGYTGFAGGVPVPRTVNLSVTYPGRASTADALGGRAVVIENLAAHFPERRTAGALLTDAALRVRRLDAIVVADGVPVARFARPVACNIRLRDLNDADSLATAERGGGEAGFCLKAGQLVRSTQMAPWLLILGGTLRDVLCRALDGG